MFKRPNRSDNEEDILRQQEEFLKNTVEKPAATVVNKRLQQPDAATDSEINATKKPKSKFSIERERLVATKQAPITSQLLGEIRERNVTVEVSPPKLGNEKGFPTAFARDKSLKQTVGSIFAQQQGMNITQQCSLAAPSMAAHVQEFGDHSYIVSGPEATEIHLANAQRLAAMSIDEIVKERDTLASQMDPTVLSFLRSRRAKKQETESESMNMEVEASHPEKSTTEPLASTSRLVEVPPVLEAMETATSDEWTLANSSQFPHMDVFEEEKLLWTTPIPATQASADSISARFDFNGILLAADDETPVSQGLHHHGDEAARAGYTVQELLILGRSSMPQQRVMALSTLANILAKTKLGYYDECFDPPLLQQLLDRELFLFLRFALDDANLSVTCAAIWAMKHLLCDMADQVLLCRCDGSVADLRPSLAVDSELTNQEAAELKDPEMVALDVVRGALQTGLLNRLAYVLASLHPPSNTVNAVLDILIRVARHSAESCRGLFASGIVDTVFQKHADPEQAPLSRALRLLRLVCRTRRSAQLLLERIPVMSRMPGFLSLLPQQGQTSQRLPLLLESLYLWCRLLDLGLTTEHISPLWPLVMSLWHRVTGLTDLGSGTGDLDLACAAIGWLRSACPLVGRELVLCAPMLTFCLHKWLAQIARVDAPTFPMVKLIGMTLSCTGIFFKHVPQKEEANDERLLETERRLKPLLEEGGIFSSRLISNLAPCSNLLAQVETEKSGRHPPSLPSLGGVLWGGQVVPVLRPDAPHLLLLGLADYLLASGTPHKQTKRLLLDNAVLLTAVESIVSCPKPALSGNCFTRLETCFFARLALLACGRQSEDSAQPSALYHRLAVKLTWLLAKADRPLLSTLMREAIFNPALFQRSPASLQTISELYQTALGLTNGNTSNSESSEPALPADWCFMPLLHLANSGLSTERHVQVTRECLGWVALCEASGLTGGVDVTARFCRVATVFLAGSDVFLDADVKRHLESILVHLMASEQLLDFNADIPGLTSFYDLYTQLLEQFAACSYGDATFCRYLLVALAQRHSTSFRRQAWGEHGAVLRVLRLPLAQLPFAAERLREPAEVEPALLDAYLAALARGAVRKEWSPIPHAIAVHHLATFILGTQTSPQLVAYQASLRDRVDALGNADLRDALKNYTGFPSDEVEAAADRKQPGLSSAV